MIAELVRIGEELDAENRLTPVGFYDYGQPIQWIIHIWGGDRPRVHLEEAELMRPRPTDNRKSNISAYPVADEVGYVFGVGPRGDEKHAAYLQLLDQLLCSEHITHSDMEAPLVLVKKALEEGWITKAKRFREMTSTGSRPEKVWVSFVPETGARAGRHLYDEQEVRQFWADELGRRLSTNSERDQPATGQCGVCGRTGHLVLRIPPVKLQSVTPLHSFNRSAFPSFVEGSDCYKWAHLGLCYRCGDTAARAFNYLRDDPRHFRELVRDLAKLDSLSNHFALYWLKKPPTPLEIGEQVVNWDEMLSSLGDVIREREVTPEADITHIHNLVVLPWRPHRASLNLDEYAFYLALMSPNVGRIAVREWLAVSVSDLRRNLKAYLDGLTITGPWGTNPYPVSIHTAQWAIEAAPGEPLLRRQVRRIARDTGIVRSLVRCAFTGVVPAPEILKQAVPRLRTTEATLARGDRDRRQQEQRRHALLAIIKLSLTYGKPEAQTMQTLDETHITQPYLCGRLLAVLERIQERAAWPKRLNTTVVDRAYGTASSAPASIFGKLLRGAEVGHLPRIRKNNLGTYDWLKRELEEVHEQLKKAGGFPRTLAMQDQAEFALGFYCQRAHFRKGA